VTESIKPHQVTYCGECPAMQEALYRLGSTGDHYCAFCRALNTINSRASCELRACGWSLSDMQAEAKRVRELFRNLRWSVLRRVYAGKAEILEAAVRLHMGGGTA
jgi:hypothetical protein